LRFSVFHSSLVTMVLEARLTQGVIFKKIVEAVKDLVTDANLDCSETGITMQVRARDGFRQTQRGPPCHH